MPVTRLNHAVLYVRDLERTVAYYTEVLDFRVIARIGDVAAFFQAPASTNDHDLACFAIGTGAGPSGAGRSTVGLYHLAWEVDTLAELARIREVLRARGSLVGQSDHSTTKALYAHDPDGIELEVQWIVPAALLDEATIAGRIETKPLDLDAEIRRYGADTRGGIGVSFAAPVS